MKTKQTTPDYKIPNPSTTKFTVEVGETTPDTELRDWESKKRIALWEWWEDSSQDFGALEEALAQREKEVARSISNWTKGHAVTKDRLREYLNKNYLKSKHLTK